ncbi:ornithine carbamoyltransferase [Pleionea sediminis]|uniref:ornithine carbamoyltransferase n=1 Tax=Pleionea sediminis TaxID=2569479 RepID=UPI0011850E50|nr:ornithine carbamoyltransferase [Pleionea sediminis]
MNSFLKIDDLTKPQVLKVFQTAFDLKNNSLRESSLSNKHFALLFEKPSLRTRASFSVGIEKLGGIAHFYDMQNEKMGIRESVSDLGKNTECWYQGIIARVDSHSTLVQLANSVTIPVINALCDQHHPCQALADFFTLYERAKNFNDWHIAYLGDGNNVARSLVDLAAKVGATITVASPECAQLDNDYLKSAQSVSEGKVNWTSDPQSLSKIDVVYTDTWTSMGDEQSKSTLKALQNYQVNSNLMAKTGAKFFMHCQPAHRGTEVTSEVCDSNFSLMLAQATNRMFVQQALLHLIYSEAL